MGKIDKAVLKLLESDLQLHTCVAHLEVLLRGKVRMDFELVYSFGDGFMIRQSGKNMAIDLLDALRIIRKNGELQQDDMNTTLPECKGID